MDITTILTSLVQNYVSANMFSGYVKQFYKYVITK